MSNQKPKIIVILGQTATGKSALAVRIAKKFNGEIISADSRQVYTGLDIGTGKITKKETRGIPHHMLDVASPRHQYTAEQYSRAATRFARYIEQKGKMPIVVGGTGFYIDALLGAIPLPNVPPNKNLRKRLMKKSVFELLRMLQKADPRRARSIDIHNKARLIRALEIVRALGKVPLAKTSEEKYNALKIGIKLSDKKIKRNISIRLFARIRDGMVEEARRLHKRGLSWRRMEELGLEYRSLAQYLQRKMTKEEMIEKLNTTIWQYARRQKTWFKRDKKIKWFASNEYKKIERLIQKFIQC